MDVGIVTLHSVLTPTFRYVIPLYQRQYSWTADNWEQLWTDIHSLGGIEEPHAQHFMGTLVFVAEPPTPAAPPAFRVIDGQQRLVTLSLLLCALRDVANQHNLSALGEEVTNQYLVHQYQKAELRYRISPKQLDKGQYFAAVEGKPVARGAIYDALEYFNKAVVDYVRERSVDTDIDATLRHLLGIVGRSLQFVQINLGTENPYRIFRSLNSTGTDLSESDLVRNFVFMGVPDKEHNDFDERYWKPLEKHFEVKQLKGKAYEAEESSRKVDSSAFSKFLRDFLMQDGKYVGDSATLEEFESRYGKLSVPSEIVLELERNAHLYDVIRGVKQHVSGFKKLDDSLAQVRHLDSTTPYPLFLNLLNRVENGTLTVLDAAHAIALTGGFVLRRLILNLSSRHYGELFVDACRVLGTEPVENLRTHLISKGFPDDAAFIEAFPYANIYRKRRICLAILKGLELHRPSKERTDISQAEIEHIMPRTLTPEWEMGLGPNFREVYERFLHAPGNLTLTKSNAELGNRSFFAKRKQYEEKSGFVITKELRYYFRWGEAEILDRGKKLAESAKVIWIGPNG